MGIHSIGHRLSILKGVYDLKVKQNIPIELDHYVPLCKLPIKRIRDRLTRKIAADSAASDAPPSQEDITRIINIIKDRDDEIRALREDLIRISEDNRKLREDILPMIKAAKDKSHPLPQPDGLDMKSPGGLSRKFSNKRIVLGNSSHSAKNPSPTIQEGRALVDGSGLDPSAAAMAASTHLTASIRDGSLGSPNAPQQSPTSPGHRDVPGSTGPISRPFTRSDNSDYPNLTLSTPSLTTTTIPSITTPPTSQPPASVTTPGSTHPSSGNNVEIFKSFRVSIDDPCYKVLPVALKKYNISADWRQYALYIVYGDQERCLGLNEKPLILFKQLDREGRKPMFMLRKHAAPAEGHVNIVQQNHQQNAGALPGGVL
jgi:protein STE50